MFFKKHFFKKFISIYLIILMFLNISVTYFSLQHIYGDVNLDSNINILDVTLLQKHIAEIENISSEQLECGNVDGNDRIDVKDVTLIQKYIAQIITVFPAESANQPLPEFSSDINDGNYYLKLKSTENYLYHQSGIYDGTNVFLSSTDEFSSENYSFNVKIQHTDDTTYTLASPINNTILIGVYRSGAYTNPLTLGKNISLNKNNDTAAQKWQFTPTKDGYYTIRLASIPNGALTAAGNSSNFNIYFDEYDSENDLQKWELIPADEYKKPEYYGTVTGDLNVRSGPDTSYPSLGVFKKDTQITIIGPLHGDWYEVRGVNSKDGNTITGYSFKNYIKSDTESESSARVLVDVNIRSGAGTSYNSIGVLAKGVQVTVIGEPDGNWYKVGGARKSDGAVVSGYSHKDYISIDEVMINTDNAEPDLTSASYNKPSSPFANSNLFGQCTWYAWGRANEVKGINVPCRGNAKTWYSVASNAGYSVGSEPKNNSIAVWSSDNYGHVAYVEKVSDDNVTISESNWYRTTLDNQYTTESGIYYYSGYTTLTKTQMKTRYGTLLGYIYL